MLKRSKEEEGKGQKILEQLSGHANCAKKESILLEKNGSRES